MMRRVFSIKPVLSIALFLVILYGIGNFVQIAQFTKLYPMHRFMASMDFFDFFSAAKKLDGSAHNIYAVQRYVTPPTAALMLYPLTKIASYSTTRAGIHWLILFCILGSIFISLRIYFPIDKDMEIEERKKRYVLYICLFVIFMYSYPVYFIFDRVNIDWAVLILFWFGMYSIDHGKDIFAGLLFGMAGALKLYPLLVIIPLIIHCKWKTAVCMIIPFILFFLIHPISWIYYVRYRLTTRLDLFSVMENVSIANTLYYIRTFFHLRISRPALLMYAGVIFVILLALITFALSKRRTIFSCATSIMFLIPLMFLIPATSYAYTLIFMIPLVPFYLLQWNNASKPLVRRLYIIIFVSFSATQIQAVIIEKLSGIKAIHFIPGAGLLGIVLCTIFILLISNNPHNDRILSN